jgi:hypothetical protein
MMSQIWRVGRCRRVRRTRSPHLVSALPIVRVFFLYHVPRYIRLTPSPALDTVPENAEVDYPELKPSDAPDAVIDLGDDEFDASSSAHSGITSYTQYECTSTRVQFSAYSRQATLLSFSSSTSICKTRRQDRRKSYIPCLRVSC